MEPITRRTALRLVGGAAGASGLAIAPLMGGWDLSAPSYAASRKGVRAALDRGTFRPGEQMRLSVSQTSRPGRRIRVTDTTGLRWKRVTSSGRRQVWTATAGRLGPAAITVVAVGSRVRPVRDRLTYHVLDESLPAETGPVGQVAGATVASAVIGMSAPAEVWGQRVSEVGAGVAARRIFADLAAGASSQLRLVEEAHAAGMLPVISYKVGGDVAGAVGGRFNAVAEEAAARLASYGLPTAVSFWHEPYGDMSGAEYVAASRQLVPIFQRGELRVGPLLNGWLLDNQLAAFASYCPDELLGLWDWVGIDTYESGTMERPGAVKPAQRIPALAAYVRSRGFDLPLGVGEYNGYSAQSIAAAGEALLATPEVWFGCLWNSTGGKGLALSGERLVAFQQTLADPRRGGGR